MEETTTAVANPFAGFTDGIQNSLGNLWDGVLGILPDIAEGIVILLAGWIIAVILAKIVAKVTEVIRLDDLLGSTGILGIFQKAGIRLNISRVFEEIVKWFILIAFFMSAMDKFGLAQVNEFLNDVLNYIPDIIIAVIITIVGVLVANFLADLAHGTARATKTGSPSIASSVTRYAIVIFTIFAALKQLGIGSDLLQSFFDNLGLGLAAAFAIAFGLGGRDTAADTIKRIRKDIK